MTPETLQFITTLIGTGGFITLFLISEKKAAAQLANTDKINDQWQQIVTQKEKDLEAMRDQYLKASAKIESLYSDNANLRNRLDVANTECAVGKVLRCEHVSCPDREPPFGTLTLTDLTTKKEK